MAKNIGFLIISLMAIVLFGRCKSAKLVQNTNPIFKIEEASFNKVVPGEENRKVTIKLSIFLDELDDNIKFDSLLFKGNTVVPHNKKINKKHLIMVEIKESNIQTNKYESLNVEGNHALLFYTNNEKSYFFHLKDIQEKEDVYLP